MAPSESLLYILFTIGFLFKRSTSLSQLDLGIHFLEEPGDVTGIRGKALSIPCRPKVTRPRDGFHVVWYHDNQPMDLHNDRRRTVFQNGTLHFYKVVHKRTGHSDQGEYRCVAVRENGSLSSRPGYLRISALPEVFLRHSTSQDVEAGSNVRFACETDQNFADVDVYWEKDEEKIRGDREKYAIISGPDIQGSILYVFNVAPNDSGNYRCVARSILTNKQRHSSAGLLTVLPPDEIGAGDSFSPLTFLSTQDSSLTMSTSVRKVKEGENVALDCVANDHSKLILNWSFSEFGQNASQTLFNVTKFGYDVVLLKNVSRRQAGSYSCTALSPSDNTSKELRIQLKVLVPPEIREKSESLVFRTSKTVRFRCIVYGIPVPDVSWLKDGNLINITGRIKHRTSVNESLQVRHSELIVSSTVASDAGIYQCMAKNSVGSSWAGSRLQLNATKPAPGAPEKVSCVPISSSQIKLTWDVSNSTNEIKAFSIHYHLTDNGEEMQKVMPSDSRSIQIDKLLPFSNYTFYLRLYMDSASEFSEKAVCQTDEEAPTDAPVKKLQIITQNSVHVSWDPLVKEKARGIITKYKIQWRSTKSPSSRVVEVTGNVLNYTITGLVPGKKYDVRVLAATSKGFPQSDIPWETFEIPINFNSNVPSPPKVILEAVNSSGIEIRWKLPNKGINVIGYKIFYRKQNSNQVGPIIVPPDTNKYVVVGLEPETWYEIMVSGFTKEDDGESGVSVVHTLSDMESPPKSPLEYSSIPEPPASLEADPISPVAINLTWSIPPAPSGFKTIKYYTVCYNSVQSSHSRNVTVICVKSVENTISISGLSPYTLYEFKVRSHNFNDQQSVFSQVMECHTLEGVPGHVVDINWKAINKTVVQVSWKKPRHVNGILRNYTLSYTEDFNLPVDSWNAKIVSASTCETQLSNLTSNVKYYLIVRASTNAGLGSYGSPKQIFIPSKSAVRSRQSEHYIGIVVGLGIGIFCIIICTTCILCRRRCLKRQVSQEFEVPSCRQSNGSTCQRDREFAAESRETEYFTFLSSNSEQANSLEITVRHLDTKGSYSNGSANGIKMSLLGESKIPSDGSGKPNVYLNESSRTTSSPFLHCKAHSTPNRCCESNSSKFYGDRRSESRTPLLTERRLRLSSGTSSASENNSSEPAETCSKVKRTYPGTLNGSDQALNRTDKVDVTESDRPNLNSILENPDFRFSNSSNEFVNKSCGYVRQSFLYNGLTETNNDSNGNEVARYKVAECGRYKDSKLSSFHFVSKEIIQES